MDKAIIVSRITEYEYKVRIPRYNKANGSLHSANDQELLTASICTLPGIHPLYNKGDIVWVDYEFGEVKHPVILGQLYREEQPSSVQIEVLEENKQEFDQLNTVVNGILTKLENI